MQTSGGDSQSDELVVAQGRLVDALASGLALLGTSRELAKRLGVREKAFRRAVRELIEIRWIFATTRPDGRMLIGWERRSGEQQSRVKVERRHGRRSQTLDQPPA